MTKLQHLSEEVLNLWNKWEIRGMVLLSLLLQIILITFGSRRKTIARSWIANFVWYAYLSADIVATVALGNLASSQGNSLGDGSTKANNSILAFWAPFLLLHLGGPDTITAYSIEDNELWSRHALGLALQVVIAFYVFSRSWGSNILTFIAIPMFIVGIIKYAERTWVLRSSCSKHLKHCFLSHGVCISLQRVQNEFKKSFRAEEGSCLLRQAYLFSHISMFMMQDHLPSTYPIYYSQPIISAKSAEDAFKIVEIELGLIYDRLYTKGPLIYSCMGIILRSITFLLSFAAFVTFAVMIDKHAYSTTDLTITYSLLVGALVLEIYAFLCLVFSDRTLILLIGEEGNAPTSKICRAIYSLIGKLTPEKRWSRSMAQHNLISSCIEDKPVKCLELFGINEMMKEMFVIRKDMDKILQGFIFEHLKKEGERIMKNFDFIDADFRRKIIDQRGDGVLAGMGVLGDFKWCTTGVEFSHSIVVWHLATDICFYSDKNKEDHASERETSKRLSEYMMYLLVNRPNMLPQGIGDLGYSYRHTRDHFLMEILATDNESGPREFIKNYDESQLRDYQRRRYNKSALADGAKLAKQLLEIGKRWEMINEVWIEMLAYAAAHCPWKEHAQQLRRGGELLTHVTFLMLHFGLSQQYQFNSHDIMDLGYWELPEEDRIKFWDALVRTKQVEKLDPWTRREMNELQHGLQEHPTEEEEDIIPPDDKILRSEEEERRGLVHDETEEFPPQLSPGEISEGSVECSGRQGLVHDEIEEVTQPIGANYSRLSSNIALKKVEELKKSSLREIIEAPGESSICPRLAHHEIEEVPQPIGANYSLLNSNIALKKVEELKKVVADKDRELDRNKTELECKERELEHKERELEHKERELEQMRSLLAASTQQQRLDALPRSSSAQSDEQGTSNEIRLSIY